MLEKGIRNTKTEKVVKENTAAAVGSGLLEVYATPAMIALIENAASTSVLPYLEESDGTVGTKLEISHVSATPVGMTVRCETELIEVDRRRLVFQAKVYDDAGLIGEGTHERFIIHNEKFLAKAQSKLEK